MEHDDGYDPKDPRSIERYARRLVGHSLSDLAVDKGELIIRTTTTRMARGSFGTSLERTYFRINPKNDEGVPDFKEAGVELKSTPLLKRRGRLVAKERLVLSSINYEKLAKEDWETSSFLRKNLHLLMVFYLHEDNVPVMDLKVQLVGLWTFPAKDIIQIRKDWEDIRLKVLEGKAHELSERSTSYLGACTKDTCSRVNRHQPFSKELAKGRAFALKQSYVNTIIESMMSRRDQTPLDPIIKDPAELRHAPLDNLVVRKFEPFIGMSVGEIIETLGISVSGNAKNINDVITKRILGVKGRIEEFEKAGTLIKSIVLETTGRLKESISFPAFDYRQLALEESWEQSSIKDLFDRRFFFIVYQKRPDGIKELNRVKFWSMPYADLMEARRVWEETVKRIREGRTGDLPKISDSKVVHIRPHGRNAQDKVPTPDGRMEVRKCFWLNAKYVAMQVDAKRWSGYRQSKLSAHEKGSLTIR